MNEQIVIAIDKDTAYAALNLLARECDKYERVRDNSVSPEAKAYWAEEAAIRQKRTQLFNEALRNPLRGSVQHADELLEALTAFANWRILSPSDWENGAVRDEFARMQRTARAVIAKATGEEAKTR
jgi:hypothetical protein